MYSLRYWYEKKHEDGKVIRLEIHKKNNSAAAMEIGDVVQELSLNIDGGEDNIDAPIVSTSLVMTFVDAYDHEDAKAKKCGNWAEFYTPDATLWKVVLLCKDAGASAFRTLWGGYVTPDSYEEDLTYRGSVTIIARDNIGHLADFPFDATGDDYGTISLRELLAEAWVKIESPMALRAYGDWMQTEGVSALDTRLNVSAFKDKSWHEAIEAALYAYGAAMRFVGDNEVMVSPLRYIANFGGSFTQSQPIFMAGATRMLTPAIKRIEETASYDLEAELQPLVKASDFSGERTLLDSENDIYGYYLSNTKEGKGWLSSDYHTIFFDPSGYGIQEADSVENLKNQMYVVADEDYAYTAEYSRYVLAQSAKVKVTFGTGFMRKRYMGANGLPTGGYYLVPRTGTITKAYFVISVTQNGVKQYLKPNGEWAATPTAFSKANDSGLTEIEHDIDLSDFTGTILLKIEIGGIVATIPYVGISAFSIGTNEAVSLLQTNRVNTNYSEENNVIIKRDPVIAPAYNITILPSIIKNGIFYLDGVTYKPAKAWAWAGGTPQQMAVYNHLQLLTFYAKPNNVIEGNIVNGDVSRFAHIWRFEGKEHILVSGRYNYISGFIEGAILREFARYESLWGSTGEAQLPATETNEETNKESSASSSSAASTYDNTTVVNIGSGGGGGATNLNDLQDVDVTASVAESVLYFNGTNWVDKTIQSLLAELKAIGDWFYKTDDGKSIGTKFNFFSEQEVSANGLSTGSNGGGGLISQVYGTTAFGTIASESNSATFNAYAIDSLYKRIVSLEGKATAVSFVPAMTSGKQIGTLSIDGVSTVLYGVDAYSKADADGTFLKLSGGTISNGNFNPLTIKGNSTYSGIGFVRGTNSAGYLVYEGGANWSVTSENWAAGYKLIHSGNYNSYALPLTGGSIKSSTIGCPLYLANTKETWNTIGFKGNSHSDYAYFGLGGDGNFFVTTTGWTAAYGLIHSGNIGSQSVASANRLITASGSNYAYHSDSSKYAVFGISGYNCYIDGVTTYFRYGANSTIGVTLNSSGNTTIGSTGDLAGTTYKLYVNGSTKIAGTIYDVNNIYPNSAAERYIGTSSNPFKYVYAEWFGSAANSNLAFGANNAVHMVIKTSGNVLIGTTTDTSGNKLQVNGTILSTPARESAYSSVLRGYQSGIVAGDRLSVVIGKESTSKNAAYFGFTYDGSGSSKNFASIGFHSVDNILCVAATSYVGIGTTSPKHKLHVYGNIAADATDTTNSAVYASNSNGTVALLAATNRGVYDANADRWIICSNGTNTWLPAGNVGIGASANEYYKLYVHGSIYADGNIALSSRLLAKSGVFCGYESTCGAYMEAGADGTYAGIYTCNNGAWQSSNIYLHNNGNVTINKHLNVNSSANLKSTLSVTGAATMSSTLSVAGSINISTIGSAANNNVGYMQGGTTLMRYNGAEFGNLILSGSGGAMYFRANGTTNTQGEMTLDGNGILKVMGRIEANSGVKVASGQALTFLDASGKEHKLTYDSTAGAFKFDGNILVLGDGQFNAIN